MKPLIIFDFFGVLSSEIAVLWFTKHFSREEAKKIKEEIVGNADLLKIDLSAMFNALSEKVNKSPEQVEKEWYDALIINEELVNYIMELRKNNHIALLSNAPSEMLNKILEKYNLYRLFDKMVISSNVGIAKPDPRIYKKVLDLFQNQFNKVCFIDDNLPNLIPAEKLGIHTILFQNNTQLRQDLSTFLK